MISVLLRSESVLRGGKLGCEDHLGNEQVLSSSGVQKPMVRGEPILTRKLGIATVNIHA